MSSNIKELMDIHNDGYSNKVAGLKCENVMEALVSTEEEKFGKTLAVEKELKTQLSLEDLENFDDNDENLDDENLDDFNETNDNDDSDLDEEFNNYDSYPDPSTQWDTLTEDENDNKDPEDAISLMELISSYLNNYRMKVSKCPNKLIEKTGDFKQHENYENLETIFEHIRLILNEDDETFKHLSNTRNLLHKTVKMEKIVGTKKAPFIYEGLQLAYITQLHNVYLLLPFNLKTKENIHKTKILIGVDKQINFFDEILETVLSAEALLGNKIKFEEAQTSEITGKNNDLAETPYAESEIISEGIDNIDTDIEWAGESIMNLINIKSNKSLVPFNYMMRKMSLMMTYLEEYKPTESFPVIFREVYKVILEDNTDKLPEKIETVCSELNPIIVRMQNGYKKIIKNYI